MNSTFQLGKRRLGTLSRENRILIALGIACALSFLLRIGIILYRNTYPVDYQKADMGAIPYNLARGLGYTLKGQPSAFFGPVATYFWAIFLILFGVRDGQFLMQLIQALMLSLAPFGIYYFSRLYFSDVVSLLAAVWFALYPEMLVLSSTMYPESLMLFFWCACLGLYALLVTRLRFAYWLAVLVGLSSGLLILTKGRMAVFIGVLYAGMLIHFLRQHRQGLKPTAQLQSRLTAPLKVKAVDESALAGLVTEPGDSRIPDRVSPGVASRRMRLGRKEQLGGFAVLLALAVTCAVILPWSIRNFIAFKAFMPFESSSGYNLWIGHLPGATGTGKMALGAGGLSLPELKRMVPGALPYPVTPGLRQELNLCINEAECDHAYMKYAVQAILSNPLGEITLSMKKVFYAWWFDLTSASSLMPAYTVPWVITLFFSLIGILVRFIKEKRSDALLWAILVFSTLEQVVFFVIPRLRYPVYPVMFMFAAFGIYESLVSLRAMLWRSNPLRLGHRFVAKDTPFDDRRS